MRGHAKRAAHAKKARGKKDGRANGHLNGQEHRVVPGSVQELQAILRDRKQYPAPVRPVGAGSASTSCNAAAGGTVVDMKRLDNIIDITQNSVVVQAGMRLHTLAGALAEHGLELAGSYDSADRTVGGAVSSACLGPSMPDEGGTFASQVMALKLVTPQGSLLTIDESRQQALAAMRMSYGLLGVVYEVTLRVRPITPFIAHYHTTTIEQFAQLAPKLAVVNHGIKYYLMPFRDRVYLERRCYERAAEQTSKLKWRLKDWMESSALPKLARSVARAVPVGAVRYTLVDGFNEAAQALMSTVSSGSKSLEQTGRFRAFYDPSDIRYSTWCFPAQDFAAVVHAYVGFCKDYYRSSGFRCDMPTIGCKLVPENQALLAPSFGGTAFTLTALCTHEDEWENFLIDFAALATGHSGVPLFNQSRGASRACVAKAYGSRLEFMHKIRRQLDPHGVMVNSYFSRLLAV